MNSRREIVPKARSYRREGPVTSLLLPGLPRHQAPQPHLLARTGGPDRSWWEQAFCQVSRSQTVYSVPYVMVSSLDLSLYSKMILTIFVGLEESTAG